MNRDIFTAALKIGLARVDAVKDLVDDMIVYAREMDEAATVVTKGLRRIIVIRPEDLVWKVVARRTPTLHGKLPDGYTGQTLCTITGAWPAGYPVTFSLPPAYGDLVLEPASDSGSLGCALKRLLSLHETASLIRKG